MAKPRAKQPAAPEKVTAFVFPKESAPTREAQTFGGMPGVWEPGKAHLAAEFGMTDDQARAFVAEGYPVVEVLIDAEPDELEKVMARATVESVEGDELEGSKLAEETMEPVTDDDEEGKG